MATLLCTMPSSPKPVVPNTRATTMVVTNVMARRATWPDTDQDTPCANRRMLPGTVAEQPGRVVGPPAAWPVVIPLS